MALPPTRVKRPYDAAGRHARALESRRRLLDTARRLFFEQGYAGTTVAAVAAGSGVSVESVYKSYGNKARLALPLSHAAIAATAPEPAEARADRVSAEETDPRRRLRAFGQFV